MAVQRRFKRMLIDVRDEFLLLQLGEMEIWDGADLALLREGLFRLIQGESCPAIAIDMRYVKYIPSGFFGMLFDWQEKCGTWFALTPPQPNVQRMLWFRQFFNWHSVYKYIFCLSIFNFHHKDKNYHRQTHAVSRYQRWASDHQAVQQPPGNTAGKQDIHAQRQVSGLFMARHLGHLRHIGRRGEDCRQVTDGFRIHISPN